MINGLKIKKNIWKTFRKKSQSSLFVILCDKLHSVSCMINDHNKIEKKIMEKSCTNNRTIFCGTTKLSVIN